VAPGDPATPTSGTSEGDGAADSRLTIRCATTRARWLSPTRIGFIVERTGALLNGPIVPEGSSASMKADRRDGAAALRYVWYRGRRAVSLRADAADRG
jgi:hypothetical protein